MTTSTLKDIINLLLSKKAGIIKFCALIFVGAVIISLLLPNKYKATTTFYAASDDLSRPEVMFGTTTDRTYYYGGNNERDRLIAMSKSNLLLDKLLDKHDLFTHYNIKNESSLSRQKLAKKFHKNFEVIKNDLDALELSFIDNNPEMSAAISNDAALFLNELVSGIIKSSQDNFIKSLEQRIDDARNTINITNDSINSLQRLYQLYDSENQIAQISELVTQSKNRLESEQARYDWHKANRGARRDTLNNMRARITGLKNQIKAIEDPDSTNAKGLGIQELNQVKPILQTLEGRYYTLRGEMARDEVHLNMLLVAKNASTPALHMVEPAEVPSRKFKPRRTILVLGSVLAAFIFSILGLILAEGYKQTMTE